MHLSDDRSGRRLELIGWIFQFIVWMIFFAENFCCRHEGCSTLLWEVCHLQVLPVTQQLRRKSYRRIYCCNSQWFGESLSLVIMKYTHTTHCFSGHFPGEPGLASCPLDNKGCWGEATASKHWRINGHKFLLATGCQTTNSVNQYTEGVEDCVEMCGKQANRTLINTNNGAKLIMLVMEDLSCSVV